MLDAPSPYELSQTYLEREMEEMESHKPFKESYNISECKLMTNAWSDRKNRSLMNIIVHCRAGTAFLHLEAG